MWFQAYWSAPLFHGGVMFSTCPHIARTQDERLLSYTIKTDETKQSCQPRFRNIRPASVTAQTTLCKYRNDRRWHLFTNKKTSCQPNSCANVLQKSWWCGLFSVPKCHCFQHKGDDWICQWKDTWIASTMPTITCQRKPLRFWWYGVHKKTYSTNVARIITGTSICAPTRLDNIP